MVLAVVVEALVIFSSNQLHRGSSWQILLTGFMFNSSMNFFDKPHEVFFREKYNYNLLSNPVPNQNLITENEIRKWENISNMILNFLYFQLFYIMLWIFIYLINCCFCTKVFRKRLVYNTKL